MIGRCLIVVLALTFVTVYIAEAQVITDGLVAYWTFDGADINGDTAKDVVGGNDGKIFGGPTAIEGEVNQALEFDGSDDYVEAVLPDGTVAAGTTVELWIKPGPPTGWTNIVKVVTQDNEMEISIEDGKVGVWSDAGEFGTADLVTDGSWHHIALAVSGADLIMYIDGEVKGQAAGSLNMPGAPTVTIGRDPGYPYFFLGGIDEVRVYDRDLSAEEVGQNMAAKGILAVEPADKLVETWGNIKNSKP